MRFKSRKQFRWFVGVTIFIIVVFIFFWSGPRRGARAALDIPIQFFYNHTISWRGRWHNWWNERQAREELPAMRAQVASLLTRAALLETENKTLRDSLNFVATQKARTIGAEVIARSSDVAGQTVIINRGATAGVSLNNVALAENGVLLGQVVVVRPNEAVVRLLNDRQSRVAAILARTGRNIGIVEGGYGLGIRLSLIPPQEAVAAGDLIVTGDAVATIPKGLLIGKVTTVSREPYEPFQNALLEPIFNYDDVHLLNILVQ